jgi:hypothetical protein
MATYIMYVPGLYAFVFTQHECTVATLYYLQVSSYIHDISTCLPHVQYIKYIIWPHIKLKMTYILYVATYLREIVLSNISCTHVYYFI